jgi:hypothetical protein
MDQWAGVTKLARRDRQHFDCATWLQRHGRSHGAVQAGGREGTDGKGNGAVGDYLNFTRAKMPIIERAIDTAALMLRSDRSRGYCLEMICADFPPGANLDHGDPDMLLLSMTRFLQISARRATAGIS